MSGTAQGTVGRVDRVTRAGETLRLELENIVTEKAGRSVGLPHALAAPDGPVADVEPVAVGARDVERHAGAERVARIFPRRDHADLGVGVVQRDGGAGIARRCAIDRRSVGARALVRDQVRLTVSGLLVLGLVAQPLAGLATLRLGPALALLADGGADRGPAGLDGAGPAAARVLLGHAARQLLGAPAAGHARGARRPVVVELVAAVALVHDLPVVGHLLHVRPVVVVAHVAHEHHLAVGDVARERAVNWRGRREKRGVSDAVRGSRDGSGTFLADGRRAAPVAVAALGHVGALQLVAVLALVEGLGAVLDARRDHHAVPRPPRQGLAAGCEQIERVRQHGPSRFIT